jgi:hypothetical protein
MSYLNYIYFCIFIYIIECSVLAVIAFIGYFINGFLTMVMLKTLKNYLQIKNKRA